MAGERREKGTGGRGQRKDGRYWGTLPGSRTYIYGKTRKEVEDKIRARLNQQEQGITTAPARRTVADLIAAYLETVQNRRYKTFTGHRAHAQNHILPALGKVRLSDLDPLLVRRFLSSLTDAPPAGKGYSASHVRNIRGTLSGALKLGLSWRWISWNPASADVVETPRTQPRPPRHEFGEGDFGKLLEAFATDEEYGDLLTTALTLGLRPAEAFGLCREDLIHAPGEPLPVAVRLRRQLQLQKWDGDSMAFPRLVPLKTAGSARSARALPQMAREAIARASTRSMALWASGLRERRLRAGQDVARGILPPEEEERRRAWAMEQGLIFVNRDGLPVLHKTVAARLERLCEVAGVGRLTPHKLRTLYVTDLLRSGQLTVREVAEASRHVRSSTMLDEYAYLLTSSEGNIAAAVDALINRDKQA